MMIDNSEALEAIQQERDNGKSLVFTNGCFDVLHVGHARYLAEAKALGDVLVVGLNSDASTKGLKGDTRPIVPQAERKEMLLALAAVDYVCLFDEETPLELIKTILPDVLVKGGDWPVEKIVGSDVVMNNGGIARSLSFHDGHSTTNIVEAIQGKSSVG